MEYEGGLKILVDWRKDKDTVNLNSGQVAKRDFRSICTQFLDAEGYDVVKREPELKACPNPICERTKYLEVIEIPSRYAYPNKEFIVECKNCGYRGGRGSSEEQAVKLHNLIADNAKRSSLCEPENEYYGLWCDEDGNVLPRK